MANTYVLPYFLYWTCFSHVHFSMLHYFCSVIIHSKEIRWEPLHDLTNWRIAIFSRSRNCVFIVITVSWLTARMTYVWFLQSWSLSSCSKLRWCACSADQQPAPSIHQTSQTQSHRSESLISSHINNLVYNILNNISIVQKFRKALSRILYSNLESLLSQKCWKHSAMGSMGY